MMWDELSKPWKTCITNAWNLACCTNADKFGFIGAGVFSPDGELLSEGTGHDLTDGKVTILDGNGNPVSDHILAHSELMSLLKLDYSNEIARTRSCHLYTTLEPCPLCIGAVVMSNAISELHYASRDPWGGCIGMFDSTPYLKLQKYALKIIGPEENPRLEAVLVALSISGWIITNGRQHVINASSQMLPEAANVAKRIINDNLLHKWRKSEEAISSVVDTVDAMF